MSSGICRMASLCRGLHRGSGDGAQPVVGHVVQLRAAHPLERERWSSLKETESGQENCPLTACTGFLVAQTVKNPQAMQEIQV